MVKRSLKRTGLLICLLFTSTLGATAQYSHYLLVFAFQEELLNRPELAHTFAVFARADLATARKPHVVDAVIISWLPETKKVCLFCPAEMGKNFGLIETLEHAVTLRSRIAMWGPFKIHEELYHRAVLQAFRLQSGQVLYKAIDDDLRPNVATNCIHAVSDIDMDTGLLPTGTRYGERASHRVTKHLSRWMVQPTELHPWVSDELGLKGYPIVQKRLHADR